MHQLRSWKILTQKSLVSSNKYSTEHGCIPPLVSDLKISDLLTGGGNTFVCITKYANFV